MKLLQNYNFLFKKIFMERGITSILIKGSSVSLILQVFGTGIGFLTQIVLAKNIGVKNFGDYNYVLSWLTIMTLIGLGGLDTSSLRYIPKYLVEGEYNLLKGFLKRSLQFVLLSSLLVSFVIILYILVFYSKMGTSLSNLFFLGAVGIPLMSLSQLYYSRLRGFKMVLVAQLPIFVIRPLMFLLIILIMVKALNTYLNGYYTMLIYLLTIGVSLFINYFLFNNVLSEKIKVVNMRFLSNEWLKVTFPLLLISGVHLILGQLDIIMLGLIRDTKVAGIYSSASRIVALTLFGIQAVNTMVAPMISEFYYSSKMEKLRRIISLASWGIFLITFMASVLLVFVGEWLLSLFGHTFIQAYIPLLVLLVGNIINALCGSVGFLLNMTGNQNISFKIIISAVVINFFLNLYLIPRFGMVGAATATTITMSYWNIFMALVVVKKLNINPTIFIKFKKGMA